MWTVFFSSSQEHTVNKSIDRANSARKQTKQKKERQFPPTSESITIFNHSQCVYFCERIKFCSNFQNSRPLTIASRTYVLCSLESIFVKYTLMICYSTRYTRSVYSPSLLLDWPFYLISVSFAMFTISNGNTLRPLAIDMKK